MNTITKNYSVTSDVAGGIRKLYLINFEDIDSITISQGECTALSLKSTKTAYKYEVAQELTTASEKSIGKTETGSHAYEQSVATKIFGNTTDLAVEMDAVASGRYVVIAQLNEGSYELYFHIDGAKGAIERVVDNAYDGFNGYNITFSHKQPAKSPKVNSSVLSTLPIAS